MNGEERNGLIVTIDRFHGRYKKNRDFIIYFILRDLR